MNYRIEDMLGLVALGLFAVVIYLIGVGLGV